MARFRYYLMLGIWGVGLAIGGTILVTLMFLLRTSVIAPPPIRFVIMLGFRAVGVRFQIEGIEHLNRKGPYLYVANHQSMMDVPALYNYLPGNLGFLAKVELRRVPVLGVGMSQMGMVFVDRRNSEKARRSTERVAQRLQEGMSFIVFPEGTRSETGHLQPFKKGAFHVALAVGATIVPVTIKDAYKVMPKQGRAIFPGVVHTVVHPPVKATDFRDAESLKAHLEQIIGSGLEPEMQKGPSRRSVQEAITGVSETR